MDFTVIKFLIDLLPLKENLTPSINNQVKSMILLRPSQLQEEDIKKLIELVSEDEKFLIEVFSNLKEFKPSKSFFKVLFDWAFKEDSANSKLTIFSKALILKSASNLSETQIIEVLKIPDSLYLMDFFSRLKDFKINKDLFEELLKLTTTKDFVTSKYDSLFKDLIIQSFSTLENRQIKQLFDLKATKTVLEIFSSIESFKPDDKQLEKLFEWIDTKGLEHLCLKILLNVDFNKENFKLLIEKLRNLPSSSMLTSPFAQLILSGHMPTEIGNLFDIGSYEKSKIILILLENRWKNQGITFERWVEILLSSYSKNILVEEVCQYIEIIWKDRETSLKIIDKFFEEKKIKMIDRIWLAAKCSDKEYCL